METTISEQEIKPEVKPVVETLTKRQVALENINSSSYDRIMLIVLALMGLIGVIAVTMKNLNWGIASAFGSMALSSYSMLKKDKWIYYLNDKYSGGEWKVWSFHNFLNRKAK